MKGRTGKPIALEVVAKPQPGVIMNSDDTVKKKHGGKVEGKKTKPRADKRARGGKTKDFHPGGEKGKLHREMAIPEGQKIPVKKLAAAAHSSDPEKRRDAIRAQTMKKWKKG